MELEEFQRRMRLEVAGYAVGGRQDSSAFLIWFLMNYLRIEQQQAIDSVCDHTNDKGIDGIYVDEDEETIYILQSKFSPNDDENQGDNDIRNFIGARQWLQNETTVQQLLDSTASHELKSLVRLTAIIEKTEFDVVSVFVTNKRFNTHASEYIPVTPNLEAHDINSLFQEYTYFADEEIVTPPIDIYLTNQTRILYDLPDGTTARVYAIPAKELVKLEGIQDRTLFYKNVRYGVGNTRVNKSIKSTLQKSEEHSNFFLYHNGITVVCGTLDDPGDNRITISNYAVINGCQSMLSFYENRSHLTNNLQVLVKIIKLNVTAPLVADITFYANNQNSIGLADLRSNDAVQRALQREFTELFDNKVAYSRKTGEDVGEAETVIFKDFAAQLIQAVYHSKPHETHLKQKLFGEEYTKLFSRRINASKIYLARMLYETVLQNSNYLDILQIRTYGLAMFFFAYGLSEIMRRDLLGNQILEDPREYVTHHHEALKDSLSRLWSLITPDINADFEEYVAEQAGFFDYKNVFKNSEFVAKMNLRLRADYDRLVRRNPDDSFGNIYNSRVM